MRSARILGQALAYAAFGALLVVFSHAPRHVPLPQGMALIQVSLAHAGARLEPCRALSAAELAARAPNMRAPLDCPRARSAVRIVVELDGAVLLDETVAPSGLARDGAATLYRRLPVAAGEHRLAVRVIDDVRAPERGVQRAAAVRLAPGQVLSVDYKPERGGVVIS